MLFIAGKCLIFTITFMCHSNALDCVSKFNPSSCNPGKTIKLLEGNKSLTWTLQPEIKASTGNKYFPRQYIILPGKCKDTFACEGSNTDIRNTGLDRVNVSHLSTCFDHYCRNTNATQFCLAADSNTADADENIHSLSISMVRDIQSFSVSCSIELLDTRNHTMFNFKCMWPQEYFGVKATITISGLENEMNETCSNSEESGLKIENISPWILFQQRSVAYCTLGIPNLQYQQSCNFSLNYMETRIVTLSQEEPVDLTCPHISSHVRWWKITADGTFALHHYSQGTISYDANDTNETEVVIMCGIQSDHQAFVLGIGKIIVENILLPQATTDSYKTTTENQTTPTPGVAKHTSATSVTPFMMTYNITENDLVLVLIFITAALVFSLGVCLFHINSDRCFQKQESGGNNVETEPQYDTIIMKVCEPESA